ncbi:hypothetical protein YPPY103_2175, partial [Yersinia pestis PY-103]
MVCRESLLYSIEIRGKGNGRG